MPFVTAADGADIFYKDWGSGSPVVFSHGWPLSADVWDRQLYLAAAHGFRAIAHDRRGHGRSTQTWHGNDMDTYADDLATLLDTLDLHEVILVGHADGGGELARYLARHGSDRVGKAVLLSAVPPSLLATETNPGGLPVTVLDAIRTAITADRAQFFRELSVLFYGANRDRATVSWALGEQFWRLAMQAGLKAVLDCVSAFSETDFTDDLRAMEIPVLVAHGDDDQLVPISGSAYRAVELLPEAHLIVYAGAPHGLCGDFETQFNADLLAFLTR
ncbi:hypothetical protein BAY61_29585 [Prauserella marina]|uniref:Non-heme chloroperoxidase n=1 Tax=Prauserella marina TaxID=530584 RepID=A0A222VWW3_9PSEU|nr:alpha/beta hydrolase [Prauserella marina]ASR38466.1 hypothetical protein BAY61_29585 [Prauserella marina]PWV78290.1 non-heme chloroperoxidase [Prauserella marina]SDC82674.1 non-heme chloroperoxidase [Prauserella marina]